MGEDMSNEKELEAVLDLMPEKEKKLYRWMGLRLLGLEEKQASMHSNMNGRVRKLELWKAGMSGAIAVITTVLIPIALTVFR